MLVDIVARGGNLLLNVGPSADGQIPLAQAVRLLGLGWWLRVNGDAVYGTRPWSTQAGVTADGRQVRYTARDGAVYALVQGAPADEVRVPSVPTGEGSEVRMLGNDRALPHRRDGEHLVIELPDHLPPSPVTVFEIRS
jgi:alpha-L-fucosidase